MIMSEQNEFAKSLLRSKRDMYLKDSDWTQAIDSPLSDSKKKEWQTYRQALRDLPANSTPSLIELENLTGFEWPTKPE